MCRCGSGGKLRITVLDRDASLQATHIARQIGIGVTKIPTSSPTGAAKTLRRQSRGTKGQLGDDRKTVDKRQILARSARLLEPPRCGTCRDHELPH